MEVEADYELDAADPICVDTWQERPYTPRRL